MAAGLTSLHPHQKLTFRSPQPHARAETTGIKKPAARAGKTVQACQVTMRTQRMKTGFNSL